MLIIIFPEINYFGSWRCF